MKNLIAIAVVAVIISAIAVPALAGAAGMTYQAGWEASD